MLFQVLHLWDMSLLYDVIKYYGYDKECYKSVYIVSSLKGNEGYLKKYIVWMKTVHYPNTIRSHLVTIVLMAPFTPKSTSKLKSALPSIYSIVIPRFISRVNTAQS